MHVPVIADAWFEARKATTLATSSGSITLPIRCNLPHSSIILLALSSSPPASSSQYSSSSSGDLQ
jgi:hypothetical protein